MKLLGYDYTISYKSGKDNTVADTLFRKDEHIQLFSISRVQSQLLNVVKDTWDQDDNLHKLVQSIQAGKKLKSYYKYQAGILRRKGRMMVGNMAELRKDLISFYHDSPGGGHSGITTILQRLKQDFY